MSSPLPYCRTNQTSSDVGMIGMITASARRRCTRTGDAMEPSENSSMISRARVRACAQGEAGSESVPTRLRIGPRALGAPPGTARTKFASASPIPPRRQTVELAAIAMIICIGMMHLSNGCWRRLGARSGSTCGCSSLRQRDVKDTATGPNSSMYPATRQAQA